MMRLNHCEEIDIDEVMEIFPSDFKAFQRELVDLNADGQDEETPIGAE
jgi:hypothetical protein